LTHLAVLFNIHVGNTTVTIYLVLAQLSLSFLPYITYKPLWCFPYLYKCIMLCGVCNYYSVLLFILNTQTFPVLVLSKYQEPKLAHILQQTLLIVCTSSQTVASGCVTDRSIKSSLSRCHYH